MVKTEAQAPAATREEVELRMHTDPLLHFTACCKIKDRHQNIVSPRPNILQIRFYEALQYCLDNGLPARIICCKPRKTGLSTVGQHAIYWLHRRSSCESLTMGDVKDTSETLAEMFGRYQDYDTFPWKNDYYTEAGKARFTNGGIRHLETAEDKNAGRGKTPLCFHSTESAHYQAGGIKDAAKMMLGATNSVPPIAGSLILVESTPNGISGYFANKYNGDPLAEDPMNRQGAVTLEERKAGIRGNGYIKIFAAWYEFEHHVIKNLTREERDKIKKSLSKSERALINRFPHKQYGNLISVQKLAWRRAMIAECGGLKQFMQEYPEDDITCFLVSGRPRFDQDGTSRLKLLADQVEPTYGRLVEQPDKKVIFQPTSADEANVIMWGQPVKGRRYLLSADTMTGAEMVKDSGSSDKNCILIRESGYIEKSGRQYNASFVMRSMPENREDPSEAARLAFLMSRYYGKCPMFIEVNNSGGAWIVKLREWKAPLSKRMEYDRTTNQVKPMVGWQTNTKTKPAIVDALGMAIKDESLDVYCPRMVREMMKFVTHPNGTTAAAQGAYDDDVIAAAIGEYNQKAAKRYRG